MQPDHFLHHHPEFSDLIRIVSENMSIAPALVEKDYWIMHCLYGLQQMDIKFELKGGTSLSKGYNIIHRFSEDIDIRIEPPAQLDVKIGHNHNKPAHCESRKMFYNWLEKNIHIHSIEKIKRDEAFDDDKYRSGGIRLYYKSVTIPLNDLKEGILLEVGFDDVTPNIPKNISSWAYDYAVNKIDVRDNRAKDVLCYHPGYTLVEKLQTISTKYRQQQEQGLFPKNFMRHYYDIYFLLQEKEVQNFIGTKNYHMHKEKRFRKIDNQDIMKNEAFLLNNHVVRQEYENAYKKTASLYYKRQPDFNVIMSGIHDWVGKL